MNKHTHTHTHTHIAGKRRDEDTRNADWRIGGLRPQMKPPAPALFAVARCVDLKENTFTKGGVENTLVRGGRGERGGGGHTPNKPLNMSQMDTQTRQKKNLKVSILL